MPDQTPSERPSDLFMDIVCSHQSPSIDCELCGRVHFASGLRSCETEEEIERLQKLSKENPDKYAESSDDAIAWGYIDGRQAAWNCPCNKLRRYEDWIWHHRELIAAYLKQRAESEMKESKRLLESMI